MDDRTSVWSIGLGLGLSTCGGLLLAAVLQHLPWEWTWLGIGLSVIVMCWFGLPVAVWMVGAGWATWLALYAWRHRNDARPSPPAPLAPAAVPVIRRVGGKVGGQERESLGREIDMLEQRPARWVAWQTESLELLDWYVAAGRSLLSDDLAGPGLAFANRPDWVTFTDEWARAGLAVKANGKQTILAAPLPAVRARVERGLVEWTLERDPPPVAPPFPAASAIVEAQTA